MVSPSFWKICTHGYQRDSSSTCAAHRSTSGRAIVVADGSKMGAVSLAPVCPITEIALLITGAGADHDDLEALEEHGLAVEVAGRRPV